MIKIYEICEGYRSELHIEDRVIHLGTVRFNLDVVSDEIVKKNARELLEKFILKQSIYFEKRL